MLQMMEKKQKQHLRLMNIVLNEHRKAQA